MDAAVADLAGKSRGGARDDSLSRAGGASAAPDPREAQPDARPGRRGRSFRDIIKTPSRDYRISRGELAVLEEIGCFRVVDAADLAKFRFRVSASAARYALDLLASQGLVRRFTLRDGRRPAIGLVSLTREGKRLFKKERDLCGSEFPSDQRVYAGFVNPAELRHDSAIYRMYQAEASRLNRAGCRIRRIVLDYELKRAVYAPLARARPLEPAEYGRLAQEVARRNHLKVVDGRIPLPDLRIEYETREGGIARIDLEVASEHYRSRQVAEKSRAGFKLYCSGTGSSARGTVRDERELTAEILSI